MRRGTPRAIVRTSYRIAAALVGDPREHVRRWRGLPYYVRNLVLYVRRQTSVSPSLRLRWWRLYPCPGDRFENAGMAGGHYFHQDIWAARRIYEACPGRHVDVGSRVDGFIGHLLVFRDVVAVDVRPLRSSQTGLMGVQADVLKLPFRDGSLESVSSLHVVEHVGLGRYGDIVKPTGSMDAMAELARVVAPGGMLYLSVPIGRERVEFDAHRVFDPKTVLDALSGLELLEFSVVDDHGSLVRDATWSAFSHAEYACGLFWFRRRRGTA